MNPAIFAAINAANIAAQSANMRRRREAERNEQIQRMACENSEHLDKLYSEKPEEKSTRQVLKKSRQESARRLRDN